MDPNVEPRRLVLRLSNVSGFFQLRKQHNNASIHSLTSFPVRFREQSDPFHSLRFEYIIARSLRNFMEFLVSGGCGTNCIAFWFQDECMNIVSNTADSDMTENTKATMLKATAR
jgi:hypothetical protein